MSSLMQASAHSTPKLDTTTHFVVGKNVTSARTKQLKRLPHVFCKCLDLPFAEDTNVEIKENSESYKFVVRQPGLREADVVAEAVEIVPGAMKVKLRGDDRIKAMLKSAGSEESGGGNWRARLPLSAMTEAASSTYARGVITITIPKLPCARAPPPPSNAPPPSSHSRCGSQEIKRNLLCLV